MDWMTFSFPVPNDNVFVGTSSFMLSAPLVKTVRLERHPQPCQFEVCSPEEACTCIPDGPVPNPPKVPVHGFLSVSTGRDPLCQRRCSCAPVLT